MKKSATRESGYVENWQAGKTVTQCNLRMLDTEDFYDVTFLVGSKKQEIRAHRYVLVSRSCVFHAMFCGPLAEKGEITIPDIEADIFRVFLRYVYTDNATVTAETVTGLMYTSRKYALDALHDLCVTFLKKSMSEDNVCQILEQCHGYGELDLEQKALKILTEGGKKVIQSTGFGQLCPDCVVKFVQSGNLGLKEEEIFEAVLSWTKERCRKEGLSDTPENRRSVLGEIKYDIRFTSMSMEYVVKVVGRSGLLTDTERIRIMDRAIDTAVDISPFKHSVRKKPNTVTRKLTTPCKSVYRFLSYRHLLVPAGCNAICFSPSKSVLLHGCQLYGGLDDAVFKLTIRIHGRTNVMFDQPSFSTRMTLQGSRMLNDVLLPKSVSLTAHETYTLCVDMEGPDTVCGEEGKDAVTVDGVKFTFTDCIVYNTLTSTRRGQIPGLLFSHL